MVQVPLEVWGKFCWKQVSMVEGLPYAVVLVTYWSPFPMGKQGVCVRNPRLGKRKPELREKNKPQGEAVVACRQ